VSLLAGRNVTPLDPAGAPTSQGQVPQIPEHNYHLQKGIAGALILPPLPPLGSPSGKNPTPEACASHRQSGRAARRCGGSDFGAAGDAGANQTNRNAPRRDSRRRVTRDKTRPERAAPFRAPRSAQTALGSDADFAACGRSAACAAVWLAFATRKRCFCARKRRAFAARNAQHEFGIIARCHTQWPERSPEFAGIWS
jgi:hypothetical protein